MLSERELHSRYEVSLEQYVTTINIEAETAASIARTMLLPAAIRWLATLQRVSAARAWPGWPRSRRALVDEFVDAIFELEDGQPRPPGGRVRGRARGAPRYVQDTVVPAMAAAREVADKLERIVPDDLWPLPKYAEILFIK